ncbi:TRAP transporter solute receptor, TAXI family [Desulfosarcina variabilis str. Montpellier]|uniref:TAXI family TRAP transporter solute-binding subunit n=1 Tax=Desulfosarcina variabilis TaxID=2300 RepID=UPI003AFAFF6D
MKRCVYASIVFLVFGCCTVLNAQAGEVVGMVTGAKTGTYIQFGKDIARAAAKHGLNIEVKESQGSLDNIKRLNSKENAAFGIVQSDVLGILYANKPEVARRLRMVYPLYNEEVHLLARKSIRSISDLEGKTVATGTKGSGNWLTLANLLHQTDIKPSRKITDLKPIDAVIAVLEGKIDAMIYVSGKPVKLFSKLEQLKKNPKFQDLMGTIHFVPLNDPKLLEEYYVASTIGPGDYAWLSEKVPTLAVKALLISFDFSSRHTAYYRSRCGSLNILGNAIRENINDLKRNGHPKWQSVDLNAAVGRWKWDTCSHPESSKPSSNDLYDELQDLFNND